LLLSYSVVHKTMRVNEVPEINSKKRFGLFLHS
jgi:hypothetical protein